jgi:hypothetical protein
VTATGTIRHTGPGGSAYDTSTVPPTADYLVEASVIAKSATTGSLVGVVGRLDPAGTGVGGGTFYTARHNTNGVAQWELYKGVNDTMTGLAPAYGQTLTTGQAYRLGLDMQGTTIRLQPPAPPPPTPPGCTWTTSGRPTGR